MFGKRCYKCDKKISKKYDFCPHCGFNMNYKVKGSEDLGFLGKEDLNDFGFKLPMGFNALLKPLMKELNKQMMELDKEIKKDKEVNKDDKTKTFQSFSIQIGIPGQKTIKIASGMPFNNASPNTPIKKITLPKINDKILSRIKDLPRKEPKTNIRRFSDKVSYELELPGVKDASNINITKLEGSLEVKAVSDDKLFVKNINVSMPLQNWDFQDGKLLIDFISK